jgi:glycosyltransferase involved in cell wall biosynthesis
MFDSNLSVVMYTPSAIGGHARYSHELLSAMAEIGSESQADVALVTSSDLDAAYRAASYRIYDFLPPMLHRSTFSTDVRWALDRLHHYVARDAAFLDWLATQPQGLIVHLQEYGPLFAPRHVAEMRKSGHRVFFTVHNVRRRKYRSHLLNSAYDCRFRAAWRGCDGLIVHDRRLQNELGAFLGPAHPPIWVVPHGIWRRQEQPSEGGSVPHRQPERLLCFGVIRRGKGIHVLLESMWRLEHHHLTIVGEPKDKEYAAFIRKLVEQLPRERVELIDEFVTDKTMDQLFEASDVVVLPYTQFSAQSGVLHAALAHSRPVVASDLGALGETVRRWEVGRVVPPDDSASLAAAIQDISHPDAYAAAAAAAAKAAKALTWTETARQTVAGYRTVIESGVAGLGSL